MDYNNNRTYMFPLAMTMSELENLVFVDGIHKIGQIAIFD